jgi:lysophospholipase L1-like esterase
VRVLLALLLLMPLWSKAQEPTRFEDIVLAFEASDRTNPPPKGALVIVGSSTIKRWYTSETDLAPLVSIRRGIVGAQTADIDYYLERIVLVYQPKSVLLYVGDNDLSSGRTPQYVADQNAKIAKRIITRYPTAKVYFVSGKPSPLRWNDWDKYVLTNSIIKAHAATDPRYHFIDITAALLKNGVPNPLYYVSDGLHLNTAGYAAWTGVIKPILMSADRRPMPPENVKVIP